VKSLKRWVKQQEIDSGTPKGITTSEAMRIEEACALKNRILRMEREILKKAAHLFAHETDENSSHIFVHRGREGGLTLLPYSFAPLGYRPADTTIG